MAFRSLAGQTILTTLRDRHIRFVVAACLGAALLAVQLSLVLLETETQQNSLASDSLTALISFLAGLAVLWAAFQFRRQSRMLMVFWLLIGAGQLMSAFGDLTWLVLDHLSGISPYPSIADIFYIASYPLIAAGLFSLPAAPNQRRVLVVTMVDAGIIIFSAMIVYWNFLLAPLISTGFGQDPRSLVLSLAYPVGDLVLLTVIVILLYRMPQLHHSTPLWLLAGGLLVTIGVDTIFAYLTLADTAIPNGLIDLGWPTGYVLIGLSALYSTHSFTASSTKRSKGKSNQRLRSSILVFLPNVWIVAAFAILLAQKEGNTPLKSFDLGCFLTPIIVLVVIRQWISINETEAVSRDLRLALEQVNHQSQELEKANLEMQIEITQRQQAEARLWHDALHDDLTGLPNRAMFLDRLNHACHLSRRKTDVMNAVLFLDLDSFKVINDSLGHHTGDHLLVEVAKLLQANVRSSDTVARLGGDEFVILMEGMNSPDEWKIIAERVQHSLAQPILVDGVSVYTSSSIGVVTNTAIYHRPEDLLRDADLAMYQAKANGKAHYELFDQKMLNRMHKRLVIENDLRRAIVDENIVLHYQPIYSLADNSLVGFEALARWQHPTRGLLPPSEFIPTAEETRLILPLGQLVLRTACRQAARWAARTPGHPFHVQVNIASLQLTQPDFSEMVEQILAETGLAAQRLVLEVTESSALEQFQSTAEKIDSLNDLGVRMEIDDFGTGYSSLSYLSRLPMHAVKIDRSFIHQINGEDDLPDMLRAIFILVNNLGIETVAEGVEDNFQLAVLKNLGCHYAQGFFLSPPLTVEEIEQRIRGTTFDLPPLNW